jgi:hypothetical protein
MANAKQDDNFFIRNAIMCWLYHYGDKNHKWDSIYKELAERETYTVKPMAPKASPNPRPVSRAKKPTTKGV